MSTTCPACLQLVHGMSTACPWSHEHKAFVIALIMDNWQVANCSHSLSLGAGGCSVQTQPWPPTLNGSGVGGTLSRAESSLTLHAATRLDVEGLAEEEEGSAELSMRHPLSEGVQAERTSVTEPTTQPTRSPGPVSREGHSLERATTFSHDCQGPSSCLCRAAGCLL